MDEGGDSKAVSQLFTRGRHDNLSVIFLTQNLFHPKQRNISLNSDYMVIFKNVRDKSQFTNLAKHAEPCEFYEMGFSRCYSFTAFLLVFGYETRDGGRTTHQNEHSSR